MNIIPNDVLNRLLNVEREQRRKSSVTQPASQSTTVHNFDHLGKTTDPTTDTLIEDMKTEPKNIPHDVISAAIDKQNTEYENMRDQVGSTILRKKDPEPGSITAQGATSTKPNHINQTNSAGDVVVNENNTESILNPPHAKKPKIKSEDYPLWIG